MALLNLRVRENIVAMYEVGVQYDMDNSQSIWRQIYLSAILSVELHQPYYIVVDAIDECRDYPDFIFMLSKIKGSFPLRFFITSRTDIEIKSRVAQQGSNIALEKILPEDTLSDIRIYIMDNLHQLPIDCNDAVVENELVNTILEKSSACFLWVKLVVEQLKGVYLSNDIRTVLDEVPSDMN